eukprot:s1080_g7.t1
MLSMYQAVSLISPVLVSAVKRGGGIVVSACFGAIFFGEKLQGRKQLLCVVAIGVMILCVLQDPWPWSMPETDSHSEGFQSEPEGPGETCVEKGLWNRLCALQHGLAEVERKISKHSSLQEAQKKKARQQRCTRNRHRWVLQQRRQVPTRFRTLLPPGVAVGPTSPEVTPAPIAGGIAHRAKARGARAKAGHRAARPRRVAQLLQQEVTQPAFCLEETVPREDVSRCRFPLSRPSTSPRLRVFPADDGNDVDSIHNIPGNDDDDDDVRGDDQGVQKEEDMLRELQILSNSFQPDIDSSSSEKSPTSTERSPQLVDHYLQHPTDPAYSRNLSHLHERRSTEIQNDDISLALQPVQSDVADVALPEILVQDPQAQRPSTASKESKESKESAAASSGSGDSKASQDPQSSPVQRPPRHAVFQDPVASDVSALPSRSHRHAVYGDPSSLGVSRDALASASAVPQESSESDADIQQILKENESSHVAFDDDVDSQEGVEGEESEESEDEESESEDVDDANLDKE